MSLLRRATATATTLALAWGLVGCGQMGTSRLGLGVAPGGLQAQAKKAEEEARLAKLLDQRFDGVFRFYDANEDQQWTAEDFGLDEKRFLNLFGPTDANDDHVVVRAELFPKEKREDRVDYIMARAPVTVKGMGGRVNPEKAEFILAVYLQGLMNKRDARKAIEEAFQEADEDQSGFLVAEEMATAYALLEAKASAKSIEKKVNRSRGQGDLPVTNDPPAWVAKKKGKA